MSTTKADQKKRPGLQTAALERAIDKWGRWHAVFGAAVAREFGERKGLGQDVLDRRWQMGMVEDCKTEADEVEEAWAELHKDEKPR